MTAPVTTINPNDFRRWAYAVGRDLLATVPGQRFELDDLVQEALIAIWQTAPKWRPEMKASLATYVTACARRRMQDIVWRDRPALGEGNRARAHGSRDAGARHRSVEVEVELVEQGLRAMPEALIEEPADLSTAEIVAAVRAAVAELPEHERRAVTAVDLLGLSSYEASPRLGVTPGYVRALRRRAFDRLRESLADYAEVAA